MKDIKAHKTITRTSIATVFSIYLIHTYIYLDGILIEKMAKKRKWGKIGAPNSKKRKAHLAKIRKKK